MFKLLTLIPTTLIKLVTKNLLVTLVVLLLLVWIYTFTQYQSSSTVKSQLLTTQSLADSNKQRLASVSAELEKIKNTDQVKRNDDLQTEIKSIHDTYQKAVLTYQSILDVKAQGKKSYDDFDKDFAEALNKLSNKDYVGANTNLETLNKNIQAEIVKLNPTPAPQAAAPAANTPATNSPPDSGYQRINVAASGNTFPVDIISADLGSTKVIVDTASDSDCANNCPVMALGNYASRSGAWAAIAGPYFCPASYPSCAGKSNSFDTLLMNKNKHYFNSDNNVYSNVPAAIFSAGSARFVSRSLEWGRDTSPDSVIANYPLLVAGGNVVYAGSGDAKLNSKGPRGFIASKGSKVYIGYVYSADTADSANVMKALGMDQALNLDEGGSTALWNSGKYVVGPSRDLPFGILFVKR